MKKLRVYGAIHDHSHAMHEFLVCMSGSISLTINSDEYRLTFGSVAFIPSNLRHQIKYHESEKGYSEVFLACVKPITLELMRTPNNGGLIDNISSVFSLTDGTGLGNDPIVMLVEEVLSLSKDHSLLNQSFQENCFLKMLLLHRQRQDHDANSSNTSIDSIHHLDHWLKANYMKDINLNAVCQQFCLSRSQLTRKFKQQRGISLIEYVLKLRFDAATKKLALSKKDISTIALDVGFNNLSHFHRQFKRRFGMTPLEFRKMTMQ